jgi:hypothetical protein
MHPTLMQDIARYRQADMLREAERARLASLVSDAAAVRPHRRLRLRRRVLGLGTTRPILGS